MESEGEDVEENEEEDEDEEEDVDVLGDPARNVSNADGGGIVDSHTQTPMVSGYLQTSQLKTRRVKRKQVHHGGRRDESRSRDAKAV